MKKAHAIVLVLVSAVLSHLLAPAIAWAQFKVQSAALTITSASGLSGEGTAASPLAFTGTTTAAISTSAAAPQYACSLATATCQMNSATNDATTSSTVGAFTLKATENVTAADLVLDVQDSAAAHIMTLTEAGKLFAPSATLFGPLGNAEATPLLYLYSTDANPYYTFKIGSGSDPATNWVLTLGGVGGVPYFRTRANGLIMDLAGNGSLRPGADNASDLGSAATSWRSGWLDTTLTLAGTTGNVLEAAAGGYSRFTFNAGAPTGTDCDAAGESGRIAIDTTNNRFYFCNGAAWQYVNEDVP